MTKEERHLWYDFFKKLPFTVHRQKVVGNYILDFYYAPKKIAVELDGSQHYSKEGKEYDIERDEYLKSQGIKVLRYSNRSVKENFESVCFDILNNIKNL